MGKLLRQVLYDKHTKEELIAMVRDGVYKDDSKKDRELAEAITMKLIDEKKENGTYVYSGGYSGRQTKRGVS